MLNDIKVGVIGVGKLGKVIAKKIPSDISLYVCDLNEEIAKVVSSNISCFCNKTEAIIKDCDYLFLALPPNVITKFCTENSHMFKANSVLLNLATSVDTEEIITNINRADISIIGLKPVCQSTALEQGQKVIFVTSSDNQKQHDILKYLLVNMGTILIGDEMMVRDINEIATKRAMELIINLKNELMEIGINEDIVEVAIKTVAVGTLLDYPYKDVNGYIANILNKYNLKG